MIDIQPYTTIFFIWRLLLYLVRHALINLVFWLLYRISIFTSPLFYKPTLYELQSLHMNPYNNDACRVYNDEYTINNECTIVILLKSRK